jgi:hypothetical protein
MKRCFLWVTLLEMFLQQVNKVNNVYKIQDC